MVPLTKRIGHYGNRFNPRGTRVYNEETDHTNSFSFWLILLSSWITLTIIVLINIHYIPHPNPSSDPEVTALCLSFWLIITIFISTGFSTSYSEFRENETNMRSEEEKKDLLDEIKIGKRTEL